MESTSHEPRENICEIGEINPEIFNVLATNGTATDLLAGQRTSYVTDFLLSTCT